MKAVQIEKYGDYKVVQVKSDVAIPRLEPGKVLVEVRAVSINPFDYKFINGMYQKMMPVEFPVTAGGDFAGVIKEKAGDISEFKAGDEVYGTAGIFSGGSGSFAEMATARSNSIAKKPNKTNFKEAAAFPLVGSSAVQAIEEHMGLQSGQKILIHGGAGGIGHIAIQLAKSIGAYVATTVSSEDIDFVKNLGADLTIDYKKEKFEEKIHDYDAVFDTVGGDVADRSLAVLVKGGFLLSMLAQVDMNKADESGVKWIRQSTKNNSKHLTRLAELIDTGKLKINIGKIFKLDQADEAFKYQKETSLQGKVALTV